MSELFNIIMMLILYGSLMIAGLLIFYSILALLLKYLLAYIILGRFKP